MLLYIDPGTGSMLFSLAVGAVTMLYFAGKAAVMKIKFLLSGGTYSMNKEPMHPIVIYSEGSRYWNVFAPVVKEFEKRETPLIFYTSSENDPVFEEDLLYVKAEFIGRGNRAFARLNRLEADVCLMTTPALDVYQLKRSKGVKHYSHILHAPSDATGYRLYGLDYFDSILLTGEYQKEDIRTLETKRDLVPKDLPVVGCTYLDVLAEQLPSLNMKDDGMFTVLVAPSWGPSGILTLYGAALLDALVAAGFHVIVRPHPQTVISEQHVIAPLKVRYQTAPSIEWDFEDTNLNSLSRADTMISDFSGVMFDYAFLFDRPFLYLNAGFDQRPYDMYDIDRDPWKLRVLSEIGSLLDPDDFSRIREVVLDLVQDPHVQVNRKHAQELAWQYRGESGKRTYEFLTLKQAECTEKNSAMPYLGKG